MRVGEIDWHSSRVQIIRSNLFIVYSALNIFIVSFIPGAIRSAEFSKVFLVFCMYRAKQVSGEQLGKTENPIKAAAGA